MKKRIFTLVIACLLMVGCSNKNSQELKNTETTTSEKKETTVEETQKVTEKETEPETLLSRDKSTYTYDTTYEMLARNPNQYINAPVKFTGTITQIVPVEDYGYSGFRMNVDNDFEQNLIVVYSSDIIDFNLLENDNVTIYAGFMGLYSYESTLGTPITVPEVCAVMIDLNDNALVSGCSLQLPQFPSKVSCLSWDKNIETTVSIEEIEYSFDKDYDGSYYLTLKFKGSKTYEKENLDYIFNVCSYKLYNEEGYIVSSGDIFFDDMNVGEKFNNITETIYDLPTGNYRLELMDYTP